MIQAGQETIHGPLTQLFGRRRFNIKPGLERIQHLLQQLGHPERSFASIHVVGTNGKGSTAAFSATILQQAGFKTGLFTSPHLVSYSERFRINGVEIPCHDLEQQLEHLLQIASPEATFFELTTALACNWFAVNQTQLAILEAGMGGRSDATAAIPALATIITPIALDHCQWLGDSLEKVAHEKVAIAAPGSLVISARQQPEVEAVIRGYCEANSIRLLISGQDFEARQDVSGNGLTYSSDALEIHNLQPALHGLHQVENASLAIALAEQMGDLGFPVTAAAIKSGVALTCWPGRLEKIILPNGNTLILDGAHNPAAAKALANSLQQYGTGRIILLLGLMEDKDLNGVIRPLLLLADQVVTVAPAQERAVAADKLAELCSRAGKNAVAASSVMAGLDTAGKLASADDLIVAAGSLFLVGEIKALLAGIEFEAIRG